MSEAANVIDVSYAQKLQKIKSFQPDWKKYGATQSNAKVLAILKIDDDPEHTKNLLHGNIPALLALLDALQIQDSEPVQWVLTFLVDLVRMDSSAYIIFEDAIKAKHDIYKDLMGAIEKNKSNKLVVDEATWLLSSVIAVIPEKFTEDKVKSFLSTILGFSAPAGTDAATSTLEAIVNLLKAPKFRSCVWNTAGVSDFVFDVPLHGKPAALYKSFFACWLLSFDPEYADDLKKYGVVAKIKKSLTSSRIEKVVRMCLTVVKNMLAIKPLCEEVVESNVLDAVRALEYEKWREEEFYSEIAEMVQLIGAKVQEVSNFDKYEAEAASGKLTWGFIHTPKFFGENIMKFEKNDFSIVQKLKTIIITQPDPTSTAIACHDIGEFVALHPIGKKKVTQLQLKEPIMEIMASSQPEMREARREALLCCQKIMLNKWMEVVEPTN